VMALKAEAVPLTSTPSSLSIRRLGTVRLGRPPQDGSCLLADPSSIFTALCWKDAEHLMLVNSENIAWIYAVRMLKQEESKSSAKGQERHLVQEDPRGSVTAHVASKTTGVVLQEVDKVLLPLPVDAQVREIHRLGNFTGFTTRAEEQMQQTESQDGMGIRGRQEPQAIPKDQVYKPIPPTDYVVLDSTGSLWIFQESRLQLEWARITKLSVPRVLATWCLSAYGGSKPVPHWPRLLRDSSNEYRLQSPRPPPVKQERASVNAHSDVDLDEEAELEQIYSTLGAPGVVENLILGDLSGQLSAIQVPTPGGLRNIWQTHLPEAPICAMHTVVITSVEAPPTLVTLIAASTAIRGTLNYHNYVFLIDTSSGRRLGVVTLPEEYTSARILQITTHCTSRPFHRFALVLLTSGEIVALGLRLRRPEQGRTDLASLISLYKITMDANLRQAWQKPYALYPLETSRNSALSSCFISVASSGWSVCTLETPSPTESLMDGTSPNVLRLRQHLHNSPSTAAHPEVDSNRVYLQHFALHKMQTDCDGSTVYSIAMIHRSHGQEQVADIFELCSLVIGLETSAI